MSYATDLERQTLIDEIARLKLNLSDVGKFNAAAIESQKPVEKMDRTDLISYTNLLKRSQPLCEQVPLQTNLA